MLEETAEIIGMDVIARLEEENSPEKELFGKNNKAFISGIIDAEFVPVKYWKKTFYRTRVRIKRLSCMEDFVPIVVPPLLLDESLTSGSVLGKWIEVAGKICSYNFKDKDFCGHTDLFLLANDINICSNECELKEDIYSNIVYIKGYVCKPPVLRRTFKKERMITNLLISVPNFGRRKDFIPCITWGENACKANKFIPGDFVHLYGRIQSRKYFKHYSPNSEEGEYRETYEVSVSTMK